jgi:hypothetical protein
MNRVRRHRLPRLFVAGLLSAAACSDSTSPNGPLTRDEASELADANVRATEGA